MIRTLQLVVIVGAMTLAPFVSGQVPDVPALPYSPDIFGRDLIAWSQQQNPQSVPQPLSGPVEHERDRQPKLPASVPAPQSLCRLSTAEKQERSQDACHTRHDR